MPDTAPDAPMVLVTPPTDGVAEIALNRPERMNAITADLIRALAAALEEVTADPDLRVIVLRGEGRSFCAGLDKANFGKMVQTGAGSLGTEIMDRTHGPANLMQWGGWMWREAPVPVICAVQGHCLGGGLQIALGADIRVAAPDAKLSIMEMKWGLVPDMSGMATLPHLVRGDVLRRLVYTAEVLDGPAAQALGLVTEVAEDPLARARALAAEIAGKSPSAIREAKRLLTEAETESVAEVLLAESRRQMGLIGGPDQIETVRAAMENRPPRYGS